MAMMASEAVVSVAGGAWAASLNVIDSAWDAEVTVATQQIDEQVYVVGQHGFAIARYGLSEWLDTVDQPEPPVIDCFDAEGAWEMLSHLRRNCLVWQCGACDAWIFTSARPHIGVQRCSSCGEGGIDFRHADRHAGEDG